MYGFVKGRVVSVHPEAHQCVVLSHRVGFEISVPKRVHDQLQPDTTVSLWLHTQVREDAITLYGFESEAEKYLFRMLLGVSGLGPKTALALLSHFAPRAVIDHIFAKAAGALSEAPGVGKKVAEKIILELSGKLEKTAWVTLLYRESRPPTAAPTPVPIASQGVKQDLDSALVHLGYHPTQVKGILDRLYPAGTETDGSEINFEVGLRKALRELSGRPRAS